MSNLCRIALAVSLLSLFLAGCTTSSNDSSATSSQSGIVVSNLGGARGFVVQVNPVFIVDSLTNSPPGATPREGAEVRAVSLQGKELSRAFTGADGSFQMSGLPAGFATLEVRIDPSAAAPDLTFQTTVVPKTVVTLGKKYPIDRQAAISRALSGVSASFRVLGTMQPLPAGTVVMPAFDDALRRRELTSDQWFFMVDREPSARFGHPVDYVFVDADSGAVEHVSELSFFPLVNGSEFWSTDLKYVAYLGLNLQDMTFDPVTAQFSLSPEVAQAAPEDTTPITTRVSRQEVPVQFSHVLAQNNTDPGSIFLLCFVGYQETAMLKDELQIRKLFTDAGVPEDNIRSVFGGIDSSGTALENYQKQRDVLKAKIKARLDGGLHSTFVFYTSSHGFRGGISISIADGEDGLVDEKDGKTSLANQIRSDNIGLRDVLACRVRLILDCCFSEELAETLAGQFRAAQLDYRCFAGCGRNQNTLANSALAEKLSFGFIEAGGLFTKGVRQVLRFESGDIRGLTTTEDVPFRYVTTILEVSTKFTPVSLGGIDVPPFCEEADPNPDPPPAFSVNLDTDLATPGQQLLVNFTSNNVAPCPLPLDPIFVENAGTNPFKVKLTAGSFLAVAAAAPPGPDGGGSFTVAPGTTRRFDVSYNCGSAANFESTVDVTVTEGGTFSLPVTYRGTINMPPVTSNVVVTDSTPSDTVKSYGPLQDGANNTAPVQTVPFAGGAAHVAEDSARDQLFISSPFTPSVRVAGPSTGPTSVIRDLALPGTDQPCGLAYDSANDRLYVSSGGGAIKVYESASTLSDLMSPDRTIRLTGGPTIEDLALNGDVLFAANGLGVSIINNASTRNDGAGSNPADGTIGLGAVAIGLHISGNRLYVATDQGVRSFDDPQLGAGATARQTITGFAASDLFVVNDQLYVVVFNPTQEIRLYDNATTATGTPVPRATLGGVNTSLTNIVDVFVKP